MHRGERQLLSRFEQPSPRVERCSKLFQRLRRNIRVQACLEPHSSPVASRRRRSGNWRGWIRTRTYRFRHTMRSCEALPAGRRLPVPPPEASRPSWAGALSRADGRRFAAIYAGAPRRLLAGMPPDAGALPATAGIAPRAHRPERRGKALPQPHTHTHTHCAPPLQTRRARRARYIRAQPAKGWPSVTDSVKPEERGLQADAQSKGARAQRGERGGVP